jgi:hypothetical protein
MLGMLGYLIKLSSLLDIVISLSIMTPTLLTFCIMIVTLLTFCTMTHSAEANNTPLKNLGFSHLA